MSSTSTTTSSDDRSYTTPISILPEATNGKKFRLQNKMIHLTYPTHLVFEDWMKFVSDPKDTGLESDPKDTGLGLVILEYSMVHEIGTAGDDSYEHTHILVKFEHPVDTRNSRFFDFNSLHPHIKRVTSKVHWFNIIKYHTKQGIPFANVSVTDELPLVELIWACDSISDAIKKYGGNIRHIGGIIAAYNNKPTPPKEEPDVDWQPWQREVLDELNQPPDDRTINWMWDPYGNSGKTFLCKHMEEYRNTFVSSHANIRDAATQLREMIRAKSKVLAVFFNFTRQTQEHKVYQALESFKDGFLTVQKYVGSNVNIPSPHVYVFANYMPDIYKVSLDRWYIRTITGGRDFYHRFTGHDLDSWIRDTMNKHGMDQPEALEKFRSMVISQLQLPESKVPPPKLTLRLPALGEAPPPPITYTSPIVPSPIITPVATPSPLDTPPTYSRRPTSIISTRISNTVPIAKVPITRPSATRVSTARAHISPISSPPSQYSQPSHHPVNRTTLVTPNAVRSAPYKSRVILVADHPISEYGPDPDFLNKFNAARPTSTTHIKPTTFI